MRNFFQCANTHLYQFAINVILIFEAALLNHWSRFKNKYLIEREWVLVHRAGFRHFIMLIGLIVLLFASPTRAEAASIPIITTEDLDGTFHWDRLPIPEKEAPKEHARTAFEHFFRYGGYGVPEDVEVLGITFTSGHLVVNVSCAIMSYGGSAFEMALVEQLIEIAAEVPGSTHFTLLIEGDLRPLVQGTEINAHCL